MPGNERIEVIADIIEPLKDHSYRVELRNGHRVVAGLTKEMRLNFIPVLPGNKVVVEFSPYDLSRGRILRLSENVTKKEL
jgi:translation initiation factor IF-1